MSGKDRMGRRYSLRIDGELFDPAELNDRNGEDVYNSSNLNRSARKVAARVARVLGVEVEVVKHLADRDVDEGFYRLGWNV